MSGVCLMTENTCVKPSEHTDEHIEEGAVCIRTLAQELAFHAAYSAAEAFDALFDLFGEPFPAVFAHVVGFFSSAGIFTLVLAISVVFSRLSPCT